MGIAGWRRYIGAAVSISFVVLAASRPASASISIDPSSFSNPSQLLNTGTLKPIIRTIAFTMDQQAYEPATPLGTQLGLDFGIQVVLVKIPDDFSAAIQSAGGSSIGVPFMPVPRLNLHKGIGDWMDAGVTYVGYKQFQVIGGDVKVVVFNPEEGPTWAVRLNYTSTQIKFSGSSGDSKIEFDLHTIKPEVLVSRRLDFADPYIGVGYQYGAGTLDILVPVDPSLSVGATAAGQASGAVAFLGVGMHFPPLGLVLTVDGEYSTTGEHSIGTKMGFSF